MSMMIRRWIQSCHTFQISKNLTSKKLGKLELLQKPEGPWSSVTLDFFTDLLILNGYDSFLAIVDRLTKSAVLFHAPRKLIPAN